MQCSTILITFLDYTRFGKSYHLPWSISELFDIEKNNGLLGLSVEPPKHTERQHVFYFYQNSPYVIRSL